jgi:hypothetical protein
MSKLNDLERIKDPFQQKVVSHLSATDLMSLKSTAKSINVLVKTSKGSVATTDIEIARDFYKRFLTTFTLLIKNLNITDRAWEKNCSHSFKSIIDAKGDDFVEEERRFVQPILDCVRDVIGRIKMYSDLHINDSGERAKLIRLQNTHKTLKFMSQLLIYRLKDIST